MHGPSVIPLLIASGFRATLPVGMAWAATRLASRWSAATRHYIWACAIAIAALSPFATIVTPRWSVVAPGPIVRIASPLEAAPLRLPNVPAESVKNPAPTLGSHRPSKRTPSTTLAWLWIAGALGVFSYVLMGHFAAWRLYQTTRAMPEVFTKAMFELIQKDGFADDLHIVQSAAVASPVVLHLWRPVVVMPEAASRWSRTRVRTVLLHEFAHIKRRDLYTQSLAQLTCALYWFNPLVWFAAHRLRLERERACDDFVLLSGTSGRDYAVDLFEIARGGTATSLAPLGIGLAAYRCQLEQRLAAIMNPQTPRHASSMLSRSVIALPMFLVACAAGALQITAGPVPMRSGPSGSDAEAAARPEDFHWAATMRKHQTIEVRLGYGSIHILPSNDNAVRVQAHIDDPNRSEIQAVATPTGVKFCDVGITPQQSWNFCEPSRGALPVQEDQPATHLVIYLPAGLYFAGSTVHGDITADHPSADSNLAVVDGDITLKFSLQDGADFKGNLIAGSVNSDFPLQENTPLLLPGARQTPNPPRIVHATVGAGGPSLSAAVVKGNIQLLRQ